MAILKSAVQPWESTGNRSQSIEAGIKDHGTSNLAELNLTIQPTSPFDSTVDSYPDGWFFRDDETEDGQFYAHPRLVVHIDEHAVRSIRSYFGSVLPRDGLILDLMSSWRSHLPEDFPIEKLVGLGLNAVEMSENPQLDHSIIHDINANSVLPFADGTFDAVVITVSIQYIVSPVDVFRDVNRVLRQGGRLHVIYSNRMFSTKAIIIWKVLDDSERAQLITSYFRHCSGWRPPHTLNIGDRQQPYADPVYVVTASKGYETDGD